MNVVRSARSKSQLPKPETSAQAARVNLYQEIPSMEVSLDDFEEYALDRLKVLRKFELLKMRHVKEADYKQQLDPLLAKLKDPTKDQISHFVLRLAYCRTEDLRRWFLAQEVALLKWRLGQASSGSTAKALAHVLPEAKLIKGEELEDLLPSILAATPSLNLSNMKKMYQVPFTNALDLVQHRQVFVKRGMAYIPETKLVTLLSQRFRANLSRQLVFLASVPTTPALQRTQGFLKNVVTVDAAKEDSYAKDSLAELNASNVNSHLKHMPLCMAQLQMALHKEKHLKHWARLQYGLFLKGAGLSLDDALVYFERMFAGKDFQKEYAYNVRHMYGKEGKRANYPPYSCSKVINSNAPNANEHHGCPYKHGTIQEVTGLLSRLGVATKDQKAIVAQQQNNNYQLACVEHFKAMHPNTTTAKVDNVGNHPNAWFHASVAHQVASSTSSSVPETTASATKAIKSETKAAVSVSP